MLPPQKRQPVRILTASLFQFYFSHTLTVDLLQNTSIFAIKLRKFVPILFNFRVSLAVSDSAFLLDLALHLPFPIFIIFTWYSLICLFQCIAGMGMWKKVSIVATVPVLAWCGITFFHEEHLKPIPPYPHLHIRTKRFPWAEGEREMFALLGNKLGHYYPQYDVEQPGAKKPHHDEEH